jgi:tetratricopeptide (TPR) repeat protein
MQKLPLIFAAILTAGCMQPGNNAPRSSADAILNPPVKLSDEKEPAFTAQTHFAAGEFAEAQNNLPTAVAQYKAALKLDAKHLPSLYRLGVVYAQMKQFDLALETWKKYVKASDSSADSYANLGFCHELAGHPEEAEKAYRKGISADAKNSPCHVNLGLLLARKGRIGESLHELEMVLSKPEAHYNLASVFESQGMKEQAKLEYKKALELNEHFADAQARLDLLQ